LGRLDKTAASHAGRPHRAGASSVRRWVATSDAPGSVQAQLPRGIRRAGTVHAPGRRDVRLRLQPVVPVLLRAQRGGLVQVLGLLRKRLPQSRWLVLHAADLVRRSLRPVQGRDDLPAVRLWLHGCRRPLHRCAHHVRRDGPEGAQHLPVHAWSARPRLEPRRGRECPDLGGLPDVSPACRQLQRGAACRPCGREPRQGVFRHRHRHQRLVQRGGLL